MPETKPDFWISTNGLCAGCKSYNDRSVVDWDKRKKEFLTTINKHKSKLLCFEALSMKKEKNN